MVWLLVVRNANCQKISIHARVMVDRRATRHLCLHDGEGVDPMLTLVQLRDGLTLSFNTLRGCMTHSLGMRSKDLRCYPTPESVGSAHFHPLF